MQEIKVRGIKKSKVEKLKEIADRNGYPSLNAYLLEVLERLAEEIDVLEYRKKYLAMQDTNIQVIEKNTEVLMDLLDFLKGE